MKLTWKEMIAIEPRLQELYLQAKSYCFFYRKNNRKIRRCEID